MTHPHKKKSLVTKIVKRDGYIVNFDLTRISNAIYRAMLASHEGSKKAASVVAKQVLHELNKIATQQKTYTPHVEEIQDIVENQLSNSGYAHTAKSYILYRQKRRELRAQKHEVPEHIKKLAKESNKYFQNTLSQVVYLRTYARWIEAQGRREMWIETVDRYMKFMQENLGEQLTKKDYQDIHNAILHQAVMPSMRLMQFAGPAAHSTHVSAYNCSYIAPTKLEDFGEIMYISMCGCGVGFSVESQNIQKLPIIKKQTGKKLKTHVIADSKEGWCHAFVLGLKTWFNGHDINFDFSKLRPLGARLKTFGGRSSGPEPLRALLDFAKHKIFQHQGRRLSNLDAYDILCKIGEVVISGGVRRSAMISLSDLDDNDMRDAKKGHFYFSEPQRSYANNSAVYEKKPNDHVLLEEWLALLKSGTGERGLFNRGNLNKNLPRRRLAYFEKKGLITNGQITGLLGTNPCGEIILQSKQFCNLTEVIVRPEDSEKSLLEKIRIATILGTYQATLTNFPYLSKEWRCNCEEEALLGVSITGQWDCKIARQSVILEKLKQHAIKINKVYAKRFKINSATCVTCVKPSGTVSLVVDSAAGMHPRHAPYYIRRIRIAATDPLFKMLRDQGVPYHPEVGQAATDSPTYVLDFPVAAPKNSVFRDDLTAIDQLEFWKLVKTHYTEHNPSVTISISENEWITVLHWLTKNWDIIGGLSFLPRFKAIYQLAPFESISKDKYQQMIQLYENIDFSKLSIYEQLAGKEGVSAHLSSACE